MKIAPITKIKSKQVVIPTDLTKSLEKYTEYLKSKDGVEVEISDIISALLLDEKKLSSLPKKEDTSKTRVSLRLPDIAWSNLEEKSKETGLNQEEVLTEISSKLIKDKQFIGWAKRSSNTTQS